MGDWLNKWYIVHPSIYSLHILIFFLEQARLSEMYMDSPDELLSSSAIFILWHYMKYKKLFYEAYFCVYYRKVVDEVIH